MNSKTITSNEIEITYRTYGDGPKAVLLVHGWMVSSAVWQWLLPSLDLKGRRVIVPDLRGAGASGRPTESYTLAAYAQDLVAVLEDATCAQATVVGHSMGGQIAQYLAVHHADRVSALVGLCPVPASGMALPEDAKGLFRTSGGDRGKQATILSLACKSLTEERREVMLDDAATVSSAAISQGFDAWAAGFEGDLATVAVPTLIVATDDPFLPVDFLRQSIASKVQNGRIAYLPGAGHYPQVERSAETLAVLEAFLANS
ncbi:MAG: alpha/beta hydrolase [Deltaproteobacteria bacterium]|nr:alpha/beta hydrolase [Deltaproteobacteria bacterium]